MLTEELGGSEAACEKSGGEFPTLSMWLLTIMLYLQLFSTCGHGELDNSQSVLVDLTCAEGIFSF